MSEELLVERDGPILIVTLNREQSLNSLSDEIHRALPETWQAVKKDPSIRAIIITGAGTRAFCVGMDLRQNVDRGGHRPRENDAKLKDVQGMTPMQNDVWVPTIVAVNGMCVAGGLHFVCDADIVIASTNAAFFDTHVMIGQVAALEPIGLLPRIGLSNALRMITLGKAGRLSAEDARQISLVSEVVDADRGLFVRDDTPLDSLLSNQNLRRFGALMAVDADGRLSGVITVEQLGRALKDATTFTGP